MDSLMQNSAYFGFFITLMGYWCGRTGWKTDEKYTYVIAVIIHYIYIIAFLKTDQYQL